MIEVRPLRPQDRRDQFASGDIDLDRFFQKFADTLTVSQGQAMLDLMDLSDNDLLDLHLARKPLAEVEPALDRSDVHEVLSMLRNR